MSVILDSNVVEVGQQWFQRLNESRVFRLALSQWLDGETISEYEVTVSPVGLDVTAVQSGSTIDMQCSGGAVGIAYTVNAKVTSSLGRIRDFYGQVTVEANPPGSS